MAREDTAGNPNVTRRLPQRYPKVTPTFTVGQALVAPTSLPRAHLHPACLARAPLAKCSFFRAKKKCVHVFFARRGDCRSRKMLQNEYLLAKFGIDTAENELSKVCRSKEAIPTPGHKSGSGQGSRRAIRVHAWFRRLCWYGPR